MNDSISRTRTHLIAVAVAAACVTSTSAQHNDVLLVDVGGQTTVGGAIDIGGAGEQLELDSKVFEGLLLAGGLTPTPADFEGDEPGFYSPDGVASAGDLATLGAAALPGGAGVSIALTNFSLGGGSGELLYWDGTGAVDFQPAPAGVTFSFSPATNFETTGPNGNIDGHPIFQLDNGAAGKPADGVYAIAPAATVDGLLASDRFFLVYLVDALIVNEDDAEAVEAALEEVEEGNSTTAIFMGKDFAFYEEAVEAVEAAIVPEPGAIALGIAGCALALAAMRRRGGY